MHQWVPQVILFCVHSMPSIRDKAEHLLAFVVPLVSGRAEVLFGAMRTFMQLKAVDFLNDLQKLECRGILELLIIF